MGALTKRLVCGALLATGLVLPALAAPPDLETFRVTRPDALLFDRAARREALAAMPPSQRERMCGAGRTGWPKHGVVQNVYDGKQHVVYTGEDGGPLRLHLAWLASFVREVRRLISAMTCASGQLLSCCKTGCYAKSGWVQVQIHHDCSDTTCSACETRRSQSPPRPTFSPRR
jgi:hypothetical protein